MLHLVILWLKPLGLWFCSHSNLISSFSPNLLLFTNSTTIPHCCPNHRTVSLISGYQGHPFSFKHLQNCFTHSLFHLDCYSCLQGLLLHPPSIYVLHFFGSDCSKMYLLLLCHSVKTFWWWLWTVFVLNFLFYLFPVNLEMYSGTLLSLPSSPAQQNYMQVLQHNVFFAILRPCIYN